MSSCALEMRRSWRRQSIGNCSPAASLLAYTNSHLLQQQSKPSCFPHQHPHICGRGLWQRWWTGFWFTRCQRFSSDDSCCLWGMKVWDGSVSGVGRSGWINQADNNLVDFIIIKNRANWGSYLWMMNVRLIVGSSIASEVASWVETCSGTNLCRWQLMKSFWKRSNGADPSTVAMMSARSTSCHCDEKDPSGDEMRKVRCLDVNDGCDDADCSLVVEMNPPGLSDNLVIVK